MADKIQLAELTEDLFCGGAAKATLLDFDRETNDVITIRWEAIANSL